MKGWIMQIIRTIRRTVATVILTAGLAYPACAAVCPKGIGGCPSPGRCFLFTDADANSFCDYTSRTGSQVPAGPGLPARPHPPRHRYPERLRLHRPHSWCNILLRQPHSFSGICSHAVGDCHNTAHRKPPQQSLQNTSPGGILDTIHLSVPLAGIPFFFLSSRASSSLLIRTGIARNTVQTDACLRSCALGLLWPRHLPDHHSVLAGGALAGTTCALICMGAGTLLAAYLWYCRRDDPEGCTRALS